MKELLDKSHYIIFSNLKNTDTEIVFQDMAISASFSFTPLGIDINSKFSRTNHIRAACNRASSKMGLLYKTKNYFDSIQLSTISRASLDLKWSIVHCHRMGLTRLLFWGSSID